jgi:hypothetical protein
MAFIFKNMGNVTICIGDLLFPLALITLFWGLGLWKHEETAWFFQWKYWKQLLICLLSWVLLSLAILYRLYQDGFLNAL